MIPSARTLLVLIGTGLPALSSCIAYELSTTKLEEPPVRRIQDLVIEDRGRSGFVLHAVDDDRIAVQPARCMATVTRFVEEHEAKFFIEWSATGAVGFSMAEWATDDGLFTNLGRDNEDGYFPLLGEYTKDAILPATAAYNDEFFPATQGAGPWNLTAVPLAADVCVTLGALAWDVCAAGTLFLCDVARLGWLGGQDLVHLTGVGTVGAANLVALGGAAGLDGVMFLGTLYEWPAGWWEGIDPGYRERKASTDSEYVQGLLAVEAKLDWQERNLGRVELRNNQLILPVRSWIEPALRDDVDSIRVSFTKQHKREPIEQAIDLSRRDLFAMYELLLKEEGLRAPDRLEKLIALPGYEIERRTDAELLARFESGESFGVTQDGAVIDWRADSKTAPAYAVTTVELSGEARSGEKVQVLIVVENKGKGEMHQLRLTLHSNAPELDERGLLFGNVSPGERVERRIDYRIPDNLPSDWEGDLKVAAKDWVELDNQLPLPKTNRFSIERRGPPVFGTILKTVEAAGNGNEIIERGESFDLEISVRNTGGSWAREARLVMPIDEANPFVQVWGDLEFHLGSIPPGGSQRIRTQLQIHNGYLADDLELSVQLSEESGFGVTDEVNWTLHLNEENAVFAESLSPPRPVLVKAMPPGSLGVPARTRPELSGPIKFHLNGTLHMALEWYDDWYLVEVRGEGDPERVETVWVQSEHLDLVSKKNNEVDRVILPAPPSLHLLANEELLETDWELSSSGKGVFVSEASVVLADPEVHFTGSVESGSNAAIVTQARLLKVGEGNEVSVVRELALPGSTSGTSIPLEGVEPILLQRGDNNYRLVVVNSLGLESELSMTLRYEPPPPNVYGVFVGVNSYEGLPADQALEYAQKDTIDVWRRFRNVFQLKKPERGKLRHLPGPSSPGEVGAAVRSLAALAGPNDTLIFYFSGHAISEGGEFVLALQGTRPGDPTTGIRASDLADWMSLSRCRTRVLVVDACRASKMTPEVSRQLRAVADVTLLACGPDQRSFEARPLENGIFTQALLEGLVKADGLHGGEQDGVILAEELAPFIEQRVPELIREYRPELVRAGHEQVPVCQFAGIGHFVTEVLR